MRIQKTFTIDEEIIRELAQIKGEGSELINSLLHRHFATKDNFSIAELQKEIKETELKQAEINSKIIKLKQMLKDAEAKESKSEATLAKTLKKKFGTNPHALRMIEELESKNA